MRTSLLAVGVMLALGCGPRLPPDPSVAPVVTPAKATDDARAECLVDPTPLPYTRVQCRTGLAAVQTVDDGLSPELSLDFLLSAVIAAEGLPLMRSRDTILLDGRPTQVIRWRLGDLDGVGGFAHGRTLDDGTTRLVLAGGPTRDPGRDARAAVLLEALLRDGTAGLPQQDARPAFLGRALDLPEGCSAGEAPGAGAQVLCPSGWTRWTASNDLFQPGERQAFEARVVQTTRAQAGGAWHVHESDCAVDGEAAHCLVLEAGDHSHGILIATAAWRGVGVVVQCSLGPGNIRPPVCDALVSIDVSGH